jgi:hypothetical protein
MVCAKCGAEQVIPRVKVLDRGDGTRELGVEVTRYPEAFIFKEATHSNLIARICGVCGYTELYADSPGELYKAYQDFLQASKEKARRDDAS